MRISAVTTFNQSGLNLYGQKMIDSFCQNWPSEVALYVYAEDCNPIIHDPSRIIVLDCKGIAGLTAFKSRWGDQPWANGDASADPVRRNNRDKGKGFRWDAIRFSHKVYSICACAQLTDVEILLWMDADMICHSPIRIEAIQQLIPENVDLCYLGREGKFSECGLYALNTTSIRCQRFLEDFQEQYDDAENGIFTLYEWHDSFVFDYVRSRHPDLVQLNWSQGIIKGEGHPLINSQWGAWLDHLKGPRKLLGKSKKKDLRTHRSEEYWQNLKQ